MASAPSNAPDPAEWPGHREEADMVRRANDGQPDAVGKFKVQIGERTWHCAEPYLHLTAEDLASMPARVECRITWNNGTQRVESVSEIEIVD